MKIESLSKAALALGLVSIGFGVLGGCGSVAPENLHPSASGAILELRQDLRWDYPTTFVDWHEMLLAGTYHSAVEDADGTYFLGDRPCFFQTHAQGGSKEGKHIYGRANVCGIYVPKTPAAKPKVFEVLGPVADRIVLNDDGTPVAGLEADSDGEVHAPVTSLATFVVTHAVVAGTTALQKGRYQMVPIQPPEGALRSALVTK